MSREFRDVGNRKLFAASGRFLLGHATQDSENFLFLHDDEFFAVNLDLGAGVFAEQDAVAVLYIQREYLAVFVDLALADGDDFAFLRFVFCAVGDDDATAGGGRFLNATNQDAVVQWGEFRSHCSKTPFASNR